jgi:methyl-accepting chemotaxis protein
MNWFKRGLALLVMAISGVVLVAAAAGIVEVWMINTPLTEGILGVFVPIDRGLDRVTDVTTNVDSRLEDARTQLSEVEEVIDQASQELIEMDLLQVTLERALGDELEATVADIRQTVEGIRQTLISVQDTAEALNSVPFVDVPVPDFERLQALDERVTEIREDLAELRAIRREQRSEGVTALADRLTQPVTRLDTALDRLQERLNEIEVELERTAAQSARLQTQIPIWIDWASVFITIILVWIVLSQLSLLMHAYRYFRFGNLSGTGEPAVVET